MHIILFLSGLIYFAMAFFATYAFFILRRIERRQRDIDRKATTTLMLTFENNLKNKVDALNSMQRHLRSLEEEEQYETAAQFRAVIEAQKQSISRQAELMNKTFGDSVNVELHIMGEKNEKNENIEDE